MKRTNLILGLVAGISLATWYVGAQQGGSGLPGGSTFSTQFKQNATSFGGAGPGTAGQVLTSNGAGVAPSFQAAGGGTPAGSNTQLQFNNAGAFGASSLLTWVSPTLHSGVSDVMTLHGSTITSQIEANSDVQGIYESHTHSNDAIPAAFYGAKSRGTTASPAIVQNGDVLLALSAVGFDGTDYELGGYILFGVNGTPGSNDMPGSITLATTADGAFTPTTRLTIGQNGVSTFTGEVVTPASTTSLAGINLPHGTAPTSPVNGDLWTTTSGLFARINGATVGPYSAGGATETTGSFTATYTTGCTVAPTQSFTWTKIGNQVVLHGAAMSNCTSNSNSIITGADLPAALRPTASIVIPTAGAVNNGTNIQACILLATGGQIAYRPNTCVAGEVWTASGNKNPSPNDIAVAYTIN